jgi:hypothetical protein
MKPITVTRTVFTLDELSDTARQYALEKMSALLYDWIDASQITECLNGELLAMLTGECVGEISSKELTKRVGLQIEWSLSNSQGDGVAIYGTLNSDDAPKLEWGNGTTATLTRNSLSNHYSHAYTMNVSVFRYDEDGYEIDSDCPENEQFTDQIRDICRQLEQIGYDQIKWLTCEETVREYLNNDYPRRFTENGEIDSIEFWSDK